MHTERRPRGGGGTLERNKLWQATAAAAAADEMWLPAANSNNFQQQPRPLSPPLQLHQQQLSRESGKK